MVAKYEVSDDQGTFFAVEAAGSGHTEPLDYSVTTRLGEVNPDGVYQEPEASKPEYEAAIGPEALATIRDEAATRRRSRDQLGRHTALDENGSYTDVKPGKFLPGFGVVRYANLAQAKAYAMQLSEGKISRP